MPYIVTTTTPYGYHGEAECEGCGGSVHRRGPEGEFRCSDWPKCIPVSRRAVGTLDEARHDAELAMVRAKGDGPMPSREQILAVRGLPEQGGTVGPLPDGTLITVTREDD